MNKIYPEDLVLNHPNYVEPFHQRFEFILDDHSSTPIHFEIHKYNNEKVYGTRFNLEEWQKFFNLITRFNEKLHQ